MLCLAYARTYNLNVTVSRSSNNYGKWQHTEKLLPKIISLAEHGQKVPVYGSGLNKRDWLYVLDHCVAVDKIIRHGKAGHIYNAIRVLKWDPPYIQSGYLVPASLAILPKWVNGFEYSLLLFTDAEIIGCNRKAAREIERLFC